MNECDLVMFPPARATDGGGSANDGDGGCEGAGDRGGFCGPERVKARGRHRWGRG